MPALTDLELTVLGNVWKKGACTAYSVMREFAASTSSYYRGSAGAIYPLLHRLDRRGYVSSQAGAQGRRPRRTYTITRQGLQALRRWLSPPVPAAAAGITLDLLRTRTYFLAALPPAARARFVRAAEKQLREQLKINTAERDRYRRKGDPFSTLAMEGALHILRARLAWMREMRRRLRNL